MTRHLMSAAVVGVLVLGATAARADLSNNVIGSFRGQVVVSKDELPEGKNDADTIKKIKAAALTELVGEPAGDVTAWHFHYTAFLSRTGATSLKMEFVIDGRLAADKQLEGVDPKSSVLSGDITIDEDEGLAKGKKYSVELVAGGNNVVAKQTVLFK
jgi:hypothetical protein|nr:hypothetical protein [Kofleriaceae bacterium]